MNDTQIELISISDLIPVKERNNLWEQQSREQNTRYQKYSVNTLTILFRIFSVLMRGRRRKRKNYLLICMIKYMDKNV